MRFHCGIIPDNSKKPYDMRLVIQDVVDGGEFMEVHKDFAGNIVVGFARIAGQTVGWWGTNLRFWRAASTSMLTKGLALFGSATFNIPLLTLWTCLGSCLAPLKSMVGSFAMGRSFCTPMPRPRCPR